MELARQFLRGKKTPRSKEQVEAHDSPQIKRIEQVERGFGGEFSLGGKDA